MALHLFWRGIRESSPRVEAPHAPSLTTNPHTLTTTSPQEPPPPSSSSTTTPAQKRVPSARVAQLRTAKELARYDWMTQNVPRTQGEALRMFFSQPAMIATLAAACTCGYLRLHPSAPPLVHADVTVMVAVSLWWMLQEWLIHAKLLHSVTHWWGREIHVAHHKMPYHHVSIDGFKVVLPTMLFGFTLFRLLFQDNHLFMTALGTYYSMGLAYEWTHFLVHTRVPMQWWLSKVIKRAHVKHHLKDDSYWFSFTCPPLDNLMGTTPDPWVVG